MVVYDFIYSDGKVVRKTFPNDREAIWYAHNEGDHLYQYIKVQ